jgi:excisionase family DNA binding protein
VPANTEISPMLTTNEVARLLNVHINTIRRWSNSGILRTYRIGTRGDRRFERIDVLSLLLEQSELARF